MKINKRILEEIQSVEDLQTKSFLKQVWSIELSHPIFSEVFQYRKDYSAILDNIIGEEEESAIKRN